MNSLPISLVNDYLARKQHLLLTSHSRDVVKVVRDLVALHATSAAGPYLALWTRIPEFQRQTLQDALYERRELVRVLCMRTTLHIVPSDELPYFHQADAQGRYTAGSMYPAWKGWSFADKKLPSPWLTLMALRIAKRAGAAIR